MDLDSRMLASAVRALPDTGSWVGRRGHLVQADGHTVPVHGAAVDRIRMDRALQHVRDPAAVLGECARVLRPGGLLVAAEPDWGSFVIDALDTAASLAFVDYTCQQVVRNALIGRQAGRLAVGAGLALVDVQACPSVVRDFATADALLGLTRNGAAAVTAGFIDAPRYEAWLAALRVAPVLVCVTMFLTIARRR